MKNITGFAPALAAIALSLVLVGLPGHAQLITDNFDRGTADAPVALDGSSPSYSATPETWTANSDFTTNGTAAVIGSPAPSSADAYVGIPGDTSGLGVGTYTLSFTIAQPGDNSGETFVAAGFGEDTSTTGIPTLASDLDPFLAVYQGDGEFCIYDKEVGQDPSVGGNLLDRLPYFVSGNANVVLTLVVNGGGSDTMSATVNGTSALLDGSTTYTADLIPITNLFLAEDSANTTSFESLELDGPAVPEPKSWAMMLGGAALLFRVLRLRRQRI
jgi:hypothetical protein